MHFPAAPSGVLALLLPRALAVVLNADVLNAGRSRFGLVISAGAAVSMGRGCVFVCLMQDIDVDRR